MFHRRRAALHRSTMQFARLLERRPVVRQLRDGDPLGLARTVQSERSRTLRPRIADADHVVGSICSYCAVGCGQVVYVKGGEVTQIEGDPASPISRGGSARRAPPRVLRPGPAPRVQGQVPPPLRTSVGGIAARTGDGHDRRPGDRHPGRPANRTLGIANLGGATLDNERNYLIKKLLTRSGSSRSRTRRAYDTAPPFSVWGRRSDERPGSTRARTCTPPPVPVRRDSRPQRDTPRGTAARAPACTTASRPRKTRRSNIRAASFSSSSATFAAIHPSSSP
jgi:hypothetical protein